MNYRLSILVITIKIYDLNKRTDGRTSFKYLRCLSLSILNLQEIYRRELKLSEKYDSSYVIIIRDVL